MKLNIQTEYFDYCTLHMPSQQVLEETLLNEDFLCIIPSESKNQKNNFYKYNLLKLLEIYGVEYFGNSYLKSLISREKSAFLKQSDLQIPSEIWTKNNQQRNYLSLQDTDFPVLIENRVGYKEIICSKERMLPKLDILLSKESDEFTLYKNYKFNKIFHAVIIGSVQNNIFATDSDEQWEIGYLKEKSIGLFSKFDFEDFAFFTFARKDEDYFLLDIDLAEIFNDKVFDLLSINWGLNEYQIIALYTIIILNKSKCPNPNVKELYNLLPSEILSKIIPFEDKKKLGLDYDYCDICNELETRFLSSTDHNRYEFIKLIEKGIEYIPKTDANSYYLGNLDFDYEDYLSPFEEIPDSLRNQKQILNHSLQVLNGQIRWNSPLAFYNVCPPAMMNTVAASAITNMYNPNGMIDRTCAGYLNMEKQITRQLSKLVDIDVKKSAGVFTSGGKVCLTYAVKCGLNRCQRNFHTNNSPVIITSMANHFSIESVGYQLGINNCIRIPLNEKQEMDINEFEKNIIYCMKNEIPIACIILSGGNTLHSAVEDIETAKNIINTYVVKFNLSYSPYIYYDLVVCWPWLFFKYYDFTKNSLKIETEVLRKIRHTSAILEHTNMADGFGFDFHKGGFSPYTTSVFITQNMNELYSINSKNGEIQNDSCYYTFTNSRSTTDIISAWNVLQSVGIEGFQAYVANILNISYSLTENFKRLGITVLYEKYTYGFSTIIWIKSPFINKEIVDIIKSKELIEENDRYIYKFTEYLKRNSIANICVRYLPKYNFKNRLISVISMLPMALNLRADICQEIVNRIWKIKKEFDNNYINNINFGFHDAPQNVPR